MRVYIVLCMLPESTFIHGAYSREEDAQDALKELCYDPAPYLGISIEEVTVNANLHPKMTP